MSEDQKNLEYNQEARERLISFSELVEPTYKTNWHHQVIADVLQQAYELVKSGKRARIILEVPPRHGKSKLASINFPAWVLGREPSWPIIITSYAQDLATDFGLEARDMMERENYQTYFNTRLRADTKAKAKWMTQKGGNYTSVGVGGPITGRGFKIGIVDDPFKNREEADSEVVREKIWKWYKSTFLTREEGNGAIIVIMTRWHDDDLVGRIIRHQKEEGGQAWSIIKLTAVAERDEKFRKKGDALWPERFPLEILNQRKIDIGPYEWSALYQQDPVDEESREFKKEWIHKRTFDEVLKLNTRRFVTIDPASALRDKSDFIGVCINYVDRENKWNIRAWRVKINAKELIDLMFKLYSDVGPEKFGIEEGVYNDVIKPFLEDEQRKRNKFLDIVELKHKQQAKVLRIRGLIPRYSSGSIFHIENECADLEEELARFPKGVYDDTLDAEAYQLQVAESPDDEAVKYKQRPYQPQSDFEGGETIKPPHLISEEELGKM